MGDRIVHQKTSVVDFDSDASLIQAMKRTKRPRENECTPCEKKIRSLTKTVSKAPFDSAVCDWKLAIAQKTSNPQTLEAEVGRLLALKSYGVIDADREPIFERITAFASRTFEVPIALVSLVDLGRQWFMSNRGLGDVRETPRSEAFCGHAVYSTEDVFIVCDATKDPRFADNSLVTGPPHIRFYAGSPLVTPDGYKIGTVCIIDVKPRPGGLRLTEKQNLMELSGMTMDALNNRKIDRERINEERSKSIACTAHDLLTPLSGIQLNLSLLMEEKELWKKMDEHQKELISSSLKCSEIINSICVNEMESFRGKLRHATNTKGVNGQYNGFQKEEEGTVRIADLVRNLTTIIDKSPKRVPLSMYVHENVPKVIISDGVKIFRSALNYLHNACKHTDMGSIFLRIFVTNKECNKVNEKGELYRPGDKVMFECIDTGPGVDVEKYPTLFRFWQNTDDPDNKESAMENTAQSEMTNSGLGLQSVANNITSIGGEYGYRPGNSYHKLYEILQPSYSSECFLKLDESASNEKLDKFNEAKSDGTPGSIFWFSIPLVRPRSSDLPPVAPKENKFSSDTEMEMASSERDEKRTRLVSVNKSKHQNLSSKADVTRLFNNILDPVSVSDTNCITEPIGKKIAAIKINGTDKKTVTVNGDQSKEVKINKSMPPPLPRRRTPSEAQNFKRALVIDDSLTIRKSIDRALTKLGFVVTHARNGMEGLRELQDGLYAVTLCDFLMPIMDGLDCVKQYREWEEIHRPEFKQYIIGISAHASDKDAQRGTEVGMNKFFSKPIKLDIIKGITSSEEVLSSVTKIEELSKEIDETSDSIQSYSARDNNDRTDDSTTSTSSKVEHSSGLVCLVAHDSVQNLNAISRCVEARGYRVCTVSNGEDTLRLLKMRKWDVVIIDEKMPLMAGTSCVVCFREWESRNRVERQSNVYLLSRYYVPNEQGGHNMYPPGFDGALGKPVNLRHLYDVLDGAAKGNIVDREIVTRQSMGKLT